MIRPFNSFSLSLTKAAELLSAERKNFKELEITGITHRDSDVESGDIFLAFPGAQRHGAEFISSAMSRGATAVLTDVAGAEYSSELPTLIVSDARVAGAILASHFYGAPLRDLVSIGITGTNGKTTVTTLLYQLFTAVGRDSGLIGTVETRIGSEVIKSERTTPEAAEIQSLAAVMRERHMRNLIMEVSSHSLELKRLIGSHFSIVGFTNLTQDHLDFHGDMDSYFRAKAKLFTHEYAELGFVNIDDPYGAQLIESSSINLISLARENHHATWHFTSIIPTRNGFEFTMRGREGILIESRTSLQGVFNLDNLLLAVAIAYQCGIDPLEIAQTIPQLTGAAGRMEAISVGQNFGAIVDYAHTPDAVSNVLQAVRASTSGKVIALLGCGGDRDASKRAKMGQALVEGCDIAIFTSDNPRSENPDQILREMLGSLTLQSPSTVIVDRASAISYAVNQAKAGDTVVVLGKGHEVGQEIAGVVHPFDDRIQLAEAIEAKL